VRRHPDGAGNPPIGWHGISVLQRLPFSGCLIPHFSPDWVTFRSIDDNSAMTSSSPVNVLSTEAEGAKPSRSVPALNGGSEPLPFLGNQQTDLPSLKQLSSTPDPPPPTTTSLTATKPVAPETGMSLTPSSPILCGIMVVPPVLFFSTLTPACGGLIRRAFTPHELPSLIEAIFSSKEVDNTIRCLRGDHAQTFIDVIDEACSPFIQRCESVN